MISMIVFYKGIARTVMAMGCKMWYNLNENEPTAKFEFRFTHYI